MSDGWDDILAEGEELLWQGQPAQGLIFGRSELIMIGFAGLVAILMLFRGSGQGGLLPVVIVVGLAAGFPFYKARRRSRVWYSLTNRRAIIARETASGRSMASYPIDQWGPLELRSGRFSSIIFWDELKSHYDGDRGHRVTRRSIGFMDLEEADDAFALMSKLSGEAVA